MNGLAALFFGSWLERLGWVLIHFLWQGAGIALLLAVALRLLARTSSHVRYVVIGSALLLCAVMPMVTWAVLRPIAQPETPSATAFHRIDVPHVEAPLALSSAWSPVIAPASPINAPTRWQDNFSRLVNASLPYVVDLWFAGVLILTLRLTLVWTLMRRLCLSGLPIQDAGCLERFRRLLARMQVAVPVRLLESALVEVPTLIGWLRPTILVPASVFMGLTPDQLDAILAHELAHVRRYDYLVNLFQTVIETVLFYHPAVWWISRKLREERENCCDDIALDVMQDRLVYVSALALLEEGRVTPPALAASGGSLVQRIRRIVGEGASSHAMGLPAILAVLSLCAALTGASLLKAQYSSVPVSPAAMSAAEAKQKGIAALVNHKPIYWEDIDYYGLSPEPYLRTKYSGNELKQKMAEAMAFRAQNDIDRELVIESFDASKDPFRPSQVQARIDFGIKGFGGDKNAFVQNLEKNGMTLERFTERDREDEICAHMEDLKVYGPTEAYMRSQHFSPTDPEAQKKQQALFTAEATKLTNEWMQELRSKAIIQRFDGPETPSDGNKTSIEAGSPSTTSDKPTEDPALAKALIAAVQKGDASSELSAAQDAGQTAYIQVKAIEIADESYQAHRNEIDAAVQKGDYKSISGLGLFKVIGQPTVYTRFGQLLVLGFDGPPSPTGEAIARLIRLNVTLRLDQGTIDVVGKFVADSIHGTIQRDDKSVIPNIVSHQVDVSEKLTSGQTTAIQMPGTQDDFSASHAFDDDVSPSEKPQRLILFMTAWTKPATPTSAEANVEKADSGASDPSIGAGTFAYVEPSTSLKAAIDSDNYDEAKQLLDGGARVEEFDMVEALAYGHDRIVKLLWDHGGSWCSPLSYAISQGAEVAGVEAILQKGRSPQPPEDEYLSPLAVAIVGGNLPTVTALLDHGTDPNWKGKKYNPSFSPLMLAVSARRSDLVGLLLDRGASQPAGPVVFEALGSAASIVPVDLQQKAVETANVLAKHGVLERVSPKMKGKILNVACFMAQNPELVRLLLAHGFSPNEIGPDGKTPVIDLLRRASEGKNNLPAGPDYTPILRILEAADAGTKATDADSPAGDPTALLLAVNSGDLKLVQSLLEKGADPNAKGQWGAKHDLVDRPIAGAIANGNLEMVQLLMDHGAKADDYVAYALNGGNGKMVKLLWDRGVRSISELSYQISQGASVEDLTTLLDHGSPTDPPQDTVITPLAVAAAFGNKPAVELLLAHGADPDKSGVFPEDTWTRPGHSPHADLLLPLSVAAENGQDEVVEDLLKHGVHPTHQAILMAVERSTVSAPTVRSRDHFENCVKLLIEAGALKDVPGDEAGKILYMSVYYGGGTELAVLKQLLDAGLSPQTSSVDTQGKPFIDFVRNDYQAATPVRAAYLKPVLDLLEKADTSTTVQSTSSPVTTAPSTTGNSSDPRPDTSSDDSLVKALHAAAKKGDMAEVQRLFKQRFDVELLKTARDREAGGLSIAAVSGDAAQVGDLLKNGADVNETDKAGDTPLHYAVRGGHVDIAEFLLTHGANVNQFNSSGMTPKTSFDLMPESKDPRVTKWEWGASEKECQRRVTAFKELFAKYPSDPNYRDNHGRTVLHQMAFSGNTMIVFVIRDKAHPADPNLRDADGNTPLTLAALSPHARETGLAVSNYDSDKPSPQKTDEGTGETSVPDQIFTAWNAEAYIADKLIKAGARLDLKMPDGQTVGTLALAAAVKANNPQLISVLHGAGVAETSPAPNPPDAAPTKTLIVHVQDSAGKPIEGAVFHPRMLLGKKEGALYGDNWTPVPAGTPWPRQTDQQGNVAIDYPAQVNREGPTQYLTLMVEHPGYVAQTASIKLEQLQPVVLARGTKLTVHMIPPPGVSLTRAACQIKQGDLDPSVITWTADSEPGTESAYVSTGACEVRAVAFDAGNQAYFGPCQMLKVTSTQDIHLDFKVTAARAIQGMLDPSLPRPIRNGYVQATMSAYSPSHLLNPINWTSSASVAEDGSFLLTNLPPGYVEVIALCRGYISRAPAPTRTWELASVRAQLAGDSLAKSITVAMEPTGTARVKVLTPEGKPLANAKVVFHPQESFHAFSTFLAGKIDTVQLSQDWDTSLADQLLHVFVPNDDFQATTDADGVATVSNLPPGDQICWVMSDAYQMPVRVPEETPNNTVRDVMISIKPGELATAQIQLVHLDSEALLLPLSPATKKTPASLTGVVLPVSTPAAMAGRGAEGNVGPVKDAALQEAHILSEVAHLKSELHLTPAQEAVLKTTMESVVRACISNTPIVKTVDQALKEILNPQQELAWEEIKEESPKVEAELAATNETVSAARLLHLNAAQKDKVWTALYQIALDAQTRMKSIRSPFELASAFETEAQAKEIALAKILTPDQYAIYTQYIQNDVHRQEVAMSLTPAPTPALRFAPTATPALSDLGNLKEASLQYSLR